MNEVVKLMWVVRRASGTTGNWGNGELEFCTQRKARDRTKFAFREKLEQRKRHSELASLRTWWVDRKVRYVRNFTTTVSKVPRRYQ